MDRIIILGNEDELFDLANAINRNYCNRRAEIIMYNHPDIATKTDSEKLFLIGHADAQGIGDYDFSDLKKHFGQHLKGATVAVCLSGCSTQSEAAQILKGGFVPATLAKNVLGYLREQGRSTRVFGTPGVLVLTGENTLSVEAPLSSGYSSTDIFVEVK